MTRVEAALAQLGGRPHPIVDPAAYASTARWPGPVVDPTPWPNPIVDPTPWPYPIVDPVPWPRPVVDPAAYATAFQSRAAAASFGRVGPIGDPPPIDFSRFSIAQLEATLHSVNTEKARLASIETMAKQQLEKLKGQQQE